MAHAVADHAHGHVLLPRYRSPRVAGAVHRHRLAQSDALHQQVQPPVHPSLHGVALPAQVPPSHPLVEDAQQVLAVLRRMAVHDLLHAGSPRHPHLLSRLPPAVAQYAVPHVALPQEGDVHERHSAGVVAEEEEVPRQPLALVARLGGGDAPDVGYGEGALRRRHVAGEAAGEGFAVGDAQGVDGTVVDGAQPFHVERHGVEAQSLPPQPRLVALRHPAVHLLQPDVLALPVPHEAPHRGVVGLRHPLAALRPEPLHGLPHVFRQRGVLPLLAC